MVGTSSNNSIVQDFQKLALYSTPSIPGNKLYRTLPGIGSARMQTVHANTKIASDFIAVAVPQATGKE